MFLTLVFALLQNSFLSFKMLGVEPRFLLPLVLSCTPIPALVNSLLPPSFCHLLRQEIQGRWLDICYAQIMYLVFWDDQRDFWFRFCSIFLLFLLILPHTVLLVSLPDELCYLLLKNRNNNNNKNPMRFPIAEIHCQIHVSARQWSLIIWFCLTFWESHSWQCACPEQSEHATSLLLLEELPLNRMPCFCLPNKF